MTNHNLGDQYATGLSRHNIDRALRAAGKDPDRLSPADLGMLEDFHTLGRIATAQLVDLLEIDDKTKVLDAGSGIGGTARYLAERHRCAVTAVDLTSDYCETNRWLNDSVGLAERISVHQADVTALPFDDDSFDIVISQHVQMNIPDKGRLYSEAHRVLKPEGILALWDITSGNGAALDYPLPWADQPHRSHLVTAGQLRGAIQSQGFRIDHWNDLTEQSATMMSGLLAQPQGPLGLHIFVADFDRKAANLVGALADGRLRVIQGIATATAPTSEPAPEQSA